MRAYGMTDVGRVRALNQDYIYMSTEAIGNLPNLFIVADGMGGHNAGDVASKLAAKSIVSYIENSKDDDVVMTLKGAIEECNKNLLAKAAKDSSLSGMGTTLVIATICDDKMIVANVGDSRLYVINDEISQVTKDHSLVAEMVRIGEIDEESAREHPDKNIITRAMGAYDSVNADIFEEKIETGTSILLCSDGLTNMVEDNDIRDIVKSTNDVESKVKRLVETANNNGGSDNIAVVIIEPFNDEVEE